MISCIYALLFMTAADRIYDKPLYEGEKIKKQVPHLNRLVLLSKEGKTSFYGSYEVGDKGGFPNIKVEHDIIMTAYPEIVITYNEPRSLNEFSTKLRAYCSPTLSTREIVQELAQHLVPAGNFRYPKLKDLTLSSEKCLVEINKEWNIQNRDYSSYTQTLTQSTTCLNSDIIGLAFQGDISVAGQFSSYAPLNTKELPKVAFRDNLQLKDLVPDRLIYAICDTGKSETALIWYFGQLHLFRRLKKGKTWWPVTDINHPEKNGAMILNFLGGNLGIFQQLEKVLKDYSSLHSFRQMIRPLLSSVSPDKNAIENRLLAEICNLELLSPNTSHVSL